MYKSISHRPDGLNAVNITDIYSVSDCISKDFTDWVNFWKHNGYWFFDRPDIMQSLAEDNKLSLSDMKLFFYFTYEYEWHELAREWREFTPQPSFETDVVLPDKTDLLGYDVVTFSSGNSAECSPLSCNHLAQDINVNSHCLLETFENTKSLVENGSFNQTEPGPFRIFAVHGVTKA
ncbi:MAG: hypothetical protein KJP04_01520 [Arenicella sp.]|nr:hypothetical protein [Arenicella sp.]